MTAPRVVTVRRPCGSCGSVEVTQVPLPLPSGEQMDFVSCQECEANTWYRADGSVANRDAVLTEVTAADRRAWKRL